MTGKHGQRVYLISSGYIKDGGVATAVWADFSLSGPISLLLGFELGYYGMVTYGDFARGQKFKCRFAATVLRAHF